MLHLHLILNLIFHVVVGLKEDLSDDGGPLGGNLVSQLRNDENLDLPEDPEYEDLRAEFLAYHTALASLTGSNSRRSLISTSCWKLNGICINYKLCAGFRFLTQVPGCKDQLKVCCFAWNKYSVRDMRDKGIGPQPFPWSLKEDYGKGEGVVVKEPPKKKRKSKHLRSEDSDRKTVALVLYK